MFLLMALLNTVLQYVPLIATDSLTLVHHMLLYECHLENSSSYFEPWLLHTGAQCYTPNMPLSWMACSTPLITWAVGSEGDARELVAS